jgi:mycofactocin system creatininase family protein
VHLDQMTWPDVAARASRSLLVVPVGSTEQHGPHLPVSTDTDIAGALCDGLAAIRPDVLIAPAVAYGSSGEHAGFAGTLSIGSAVTEELLVELGRSADEFSGVLFVSTHGGNATAVAAAVVRLRADSRRVRAWSPGPPPAPGPTARPRGGSDAHAGQTETAVMMALRPAVVRTEAAATGCTTPLAELMPRLRFDGIRAVSPNGVLGDPTGASPEAGRELLDRWVVELTAAVAGWP